MSIELNPEQLQELDSCRGAVPRVVDPRTNTEYVLLSEAEYASLIAVLENEPAQRQIRAVGLRNAAGRMSEPL